MAHAEICPVCSGTGGFEGTSDTTVKWCDCHGCGGKGWVEVGHVDVFSGMSLAEIQTVADKLVTNHNTRIDKCFVLIANLAARLQ